ncbi:MAG: amino acid adenylation domain-containing protein, partial [Hyphomicrobiaceae bacterium]|nr:amino acid adenylation domain-containing protein [Hyphomicrobiaceae bacterium]
MHQPEATDLPENSIAIIGMAGRFPGARSVQDFWKNQLAGRDAVSQFTVDELEIVDKDSVRDDPHYVRARSIIDDVDLFDADFFRIYPLEAISMDPQQRLFLECSWQAFEAAGYDPAAITDAVGVYAGSSFPTYLLAQLCRQKGMIDRITEDYQTGSFSEVVGNGLDFIASRTAYKLGLRGPAISMGTACSTSLVAVVQACQALLTYQCDMALAGGSSISLPQKRGTHYIEGGMTSLDGHCRAFDADATGTVFGSGVGVVLLKRLEDAFQDGDCIHAVIRGFGLNNDGADKVGFTAPSIEGQATVITMAQDLADIEPDTIGYIEAHGTGTPLGDPIELAALSKAFRLRTDKTQFCTIGTAKTNVGHLDAAAGVTGLINATHVVRDGVFPPTLHFKAPNPKFDMSGSPFKVATESTPWNVDGGKRRAGVSAFGVGGTNAHVVLEEAPKRDASHSSRPAHVLPISARSRTALIEMQGNLAQHLAAHPDAPLADIAWTLQAGRRRFDHGAVVIAGSIAEARAALTGDAPDKLQQRTTRSDRPKIHFLFPGQGSQYVRMAHETYRIEPVFREAVDRCAGFLEPLIGADLRELLFPQKSDDAAAAERLKDTAIAQPAVFTVEYALAQLWRSWGIKPDVLVGHSVGEFTAACVAEIFSLQDGLRMVAARGRIMQDVAPGRMCAVGLGEADVRRYLSASLSVAAVNAPKACVVAGPVEDLAEFEALMTREKITCRALVTSHAFHSSMMDTVVPSFRQVVAGVELNAPRTPIISTVTGKPLTDAEATDPDYWAAHLRQPVRFSDAVALCRRDEDAVLLEVGPGNTLNTLARLHPAAAADQVVVSSLGGPNREEPDSDTLMHALASLWLAGVTVDWKALHGSEAPDRRRVALPTYPFERQRYWFEPEQDATTATSSKQATPHNARRQLVPIQMMAPLSDDFAMPRLENSATTAATAIDRKDRIRSAMIDIFRELSGRPLDNVPPGATFLELGFDSLFLTQATRALQKRVEVKVTFRQLLGELGTFDSLAAHADKTLPPEKFAASEQSPSPQLVAAPAEASALAQAQLGAAVPSALPPAPLLQAVSPNQAGTVAGENLERIVRDQLQVMQQIFAAQLSTLAGQTAVGMAFAAPPTAATPPSALAQQPQPTAVPATIKPAFAAPKEELMSSAVARMNSQFSRDRAKTSVGLTPKQTVKLNEIIEKYVAKTSGSKAQTQAHRNHLADPRVVSGFQPIWKEMVYSIITERSKGSKLWDVDGNEYIDILNGYGPILFGHRPDFVENAIQAQAGRGFETGPQTPLAGEIAELFCELTGNERMTFCNTGSEAVMAAMRLARTVTGNDIVVMFDGDYHGMFDEVLVKPNSASPGALPLAPGIPKDSVSNIVVLDYGTEEALAWIRDNADDIAAVIVEPVQSRRPDFRPVEFLKSVREITAKAGAALVFDEVVTGFRTHPGGCQAMFGIRADMATYGKVLGGGMPVGVLAGKSAFMDALDGGMWQYGDESVPEVGMTFFAGTFVRHPLTLAAIKAVLQHIKREGSALYDRVGARMDDMAARINAIFMRYGIPAKLKHFASWGYFKFPSDERYGSLFHYLLRYHGVHFYEGFPCFLTSAHTDTDIDRIVAAFEMAAIEMCEGGFFNSARLPDGELARLPAVAAAAASEPTRVPLTEPQREIFHAAMLGDDVSCAFNESFSIDFEGSLDRAALVGALNEIIDRHEALRGHITTDGTHIEIVPRLIIDPAVTDLSSLSEVEKTAAHEEILASDARQPFDIFAGPLVRAQIVTLDDNRHSLIFSAHHVVCDGWSGGLIVGDLAEIYSAKVESRTPDLEPAASFSRYAEEEQRALQSGETSGDAAYWLEQYKTIAELPELPSDHPRGVSRTYAGSTMVRTIPFGIYSSLKQAGARHGASVFAALLASYVTLIHRLSKHRDLAISIPMAGQAQLDETNLVGHCVHTLPLRFSVDADMSLETVIAKARDALLDAYDHQNYTYGRLIRDAKVARDPSRLPITELQFNVEQFGEGLAFSGLKAKSHANPKAAVNVDIFLNIVESPAGLKLECDYNTDLYEDTTISSWLEAFEKIVAQVGRDTSLRLSALDLPLERVSGAPACKLSSEDTARIAIWNDTATEFPSDRSIVDLFEACAAKAPEAIAVEFGSDRMTYRELNTRANQLAHYLIGQGAVAGGLVACCLERSPELIVGVLAILKAGCGYVPLDPRFPGSRLEFMLEDARAKLIVTQKSLGLTGKTARPVLVDDPDCGITACATENPGVGTAPDSPAYVIYTSGSTGKPKGVLVDHRAVVRLVRDTNYCTFATNDVFLVNAPISFDASTFEVWGPLLNGARAVVMPAGEPSLAELGRVIREHGVTKIFLTTGLFHVMVEQRLGDLANLKHLMTGGEVLSPEHMQKVIDAAPGVTLSAVYGPTEGTTFTTFHTFEKGAKVPASVPIGKPIANARCYVLNEDLEQVAIGEAGELFIAGNGLAVGYLNNQELTEQRFIVHEIRKGLTERLYRTGDRVRWLDDGTLEFHGRVDNQIKLRGFRIELGEIEVLLQRQTGVRQACVIAERDGGRVSRLVAFCAATEDA